MLLFLLTQQNHTAMPYAKTPSPLETVQYFRGEGAFGPAFLFIKKELAS